MAGHLTAGAVAIAVLFLAGAAVAQEAGEAKAGVPGDPTRPPASLLRAAGPSPAAAAMTGPVLQSVMISAARKSAIIGSQRVELGGTFRGSRLTALSESEAILEGPEGRTVLKLIPDVQKTPVATAEDAGSRTPAASQPPRKTRATR
jgi:hypothetical protein